MGRFNNFQFSIFNKKSTKSEIEIAHFLICIQEDLFTIGSVFAGWKARLPAPDRRDGGQGDLSILSTRVKEMEKRIDLMEKDLTPLTNFILHGGSAHGANVHIVRSVCRRVERQIVALFSNQTSLLRPAMAGLRTGTAAISVQLEEKDAILMYFNRLSDLFFVLARFINKKEHIEETVWSGIAKKKK